MDGAMGQEEDVVEAVLTCEGDFHDPELNSRIERFRHRLKDLLLTEQQRLQVKKIEPWNSVKVTVTIPRGAALRLRQLAQNGNDTLRQMGVLSVQIQGDTQISLTLAGRNNESTQLVLCTPPASQAGNSSLPLNMVGSESGIHNSEERGSSQGSSGDEVTRKNIVNYLRQGSVLRPNPALFDSILGTGASSVPVLGFGLDIPQPLESVSGPSGSNTLFRPNNIVTSTLQSQAVGGSHLNSSFPFTKTTGAFHPPVPRLSFSAGQSSTANSTHHLQLGNTSSGRLMGPLAHDAKTARSSLSYSGPSPNVFQHSMNTFSPVGGTRLSSVTSNTNMVSLPLRVPPSSSPTSSYMIDLPPPPPYPSTGNTSRQGKPVTSSSPLLVNLLQTDPLTAAVGLASGSPNKSMTTGEFNSSSPPKKKQWSKKTKEDLMKSYLFNDNAVNSRTDFHSHMFASEIDLDQNSIRMAEDAITCLELMQSRAGVLPTSHIPLPDFKPLFSSDRSVSESHSSYSLDEFHSDFSRSAIVAGCSSSKISDLNGQESFPIDLDPFSRETAAGKIINPYTGQLEPRDSVVDNVQTRVSDMTSHSQGANFATQILARKAKELKKINEISVPNSSSQMLDVNVMKTATPIHLSVSSSTAAFVHSGVPLQASSDKLTSSVSTHQRNFLSDGLARETKDGSLSSNIYAVTTKPWQEMDNNTDVHFKGSLNTLINSSSKRASPASSSHLHKNLPPALVPPNGPLAARQTVRYNMNPSHQHVVVSSCSSGAPSSHHGSVMYSNVTVTSSLPPSVSHMSHISQTQAQQSAGSIRMTASTDFQNSLSKSTSVSSSISLTPHLGSTMSSLQSPQIQTSARLKTPDSGHVSSSVQHSQAASSDIVEGSIAPKTSSSNLLNSLRDKHLDTQSSPPDNKASSEGDENSNHSGLITETLPEHSGTVALLEHSGVKAENHDSGVGSSSERSDDTPSEPGDSEFRPGQTGGDVEDSSKISLQKTVNCKLESKVNSSSNTITVGYMVNPSDGAAQSKLTQVKENSPVSKTNVLTSAPSSTVSDISQFFQTHIMSMDKQIGLLTGGPRMSSVSMAVEESKGQSHINCPGKARENGQSSEDMGNNSNVKINGPSSQSNIEKMMKTMTELQYKKSRSSPKQNIKKGSIDAPPDHLKLQTEVIDKMSKLHHFSESAKQTSDMSTKPTSSDKASSPDALSQRLNVSEDRPDQLVFDMDELVNGRTMGHSSSGGGIETKGGSNITSIYSKRSSPVNVNMLNHIYAPGLPLPRRLTESVQRLVKPLPAAETSVSYSLMRPCKSPGSGGSPRAGSGASIQSSVRMSAVRSPGASMPKVIPSDKHSLLSGGLDLAGLTSLQYASTDQTDLAAAMASCKSGSTPLTADVLLQDSHCISSSQKSPPNVLLDSKSYSGKMLSQSFPPHKSRDLKPNITHTNHGLFSFTEKHFSSSIHPAHHSQLPRSKAEPSQASSQENRLHPSNRSHQDILQNHLPSVSDTGQARLAMQQPTAAENTHSTNSSRVIENSSAYTSHSNASSPVMPVLQRGQEFPVTPTVACSMPNISSQPSSSISSVKEISTISTGSSVSLSNATQNKHVPYSNNIVGTSGTTVNVSAKSSSVSTSLPVLSVVSTAPSALGRIGDYSGYSSPPKLKKTNITSNPSTSSSRSGSNTPQFSRNLFESVSGTLTREHSSANKLEHPRGNNSHKPVVHKNLQLTSHGSDSQCSSFSSVLSLESKDDLVVKNVRLKSAEGGDKRTASVVSTSKIDLPKVGPVSKPIQTHDSSPSTFLSTEVINLDFSLPPQACNAISLNIGASKSASCSGGAVKTSMSASDNFTEVGSLRTSQPSTSSLPTTSHISSGLSRSLDNMIGTTAAEKEEVVSKLPPSVSNSSSMLSVKEPILEILASALGSTISSKISPGKSFVEKQVSSGGSSMEFRRVEEESEMVTIQSDTQRPPINLELSLSDSAAVQNSDPLYRRPARKRKNPHDDETETSSSEPTPVKQPHLVNSPEPLIETSVISPEVDSDVSQVDFHDETESAENNGYVGEHHSQAKSSTVVIIESQENGSEIGNKITQEDMDSQRNPVKSHSISVPESKEQDSTKESRSHQSATSTVGTSEDSQCYKMSSDENKDSAQKESGLNRNAVASGVDGKERRIHRTSITSSAVEDKDITKDGHLSRPSIVDHKENSLKDNKPYKVTSDLHEDKDDHRESRSHRSSSLDDKDKAKSGMDISVDKGHADSKFDDGQKKSHRIKRQFYAYVPEKSIDQTYFDTPILSGRTRSKNKPSDHLDGTSAQDEIDVTTNPEAQVIHHPTGPHQAASVKADGSAESTGGKRPIRSVRVKDNSQDQNASKRRRVQQHR